MPRSGARMRLPIALLAILALAGCSPGAGPAPVSGSPVPSADPSAMSMLSTPAELQETTHARFSRARAIREIFFGASVVVYASLELCRNTSAPRIA